MAQMETGYLARLPDDLQAFVAHIECESGIEITVEVDNSRAGRHRGEPDPLACIANESEARLLIPSEDFFPEGSVLHELLHIHRFLVDRVAQISVCDDYWCPERETVLTQLDNCLEHLVIVPEELGRRPERRGRWVAVMDRVLNQVQSGELRDADRDFFVLYSWVFIRYVLPDDDLAEKALAALESLNLRDHGDQFYDAVLAALSSKEAATRVCVEQFGLSKELICLDYFDPRQRKRRQTLERGPPSRD